jgi:hypothetical protein
LNSAWHNGQEPSKKSRSLVRILSLKAPLRTSEAHAGRRLQ